MHISKSEWHWPCNDGNVVATLFIVEIIWDSWYTIALYYLETTDIQEVIFYETHLANNKQFKKLDECMHIDQLMFDM